MRFRLSRNSSDKLSSHTRMALLDVYHGAASGIFSCDEHLAGLHPSHGTELCTVVEAMWSYEVLFLVQGDPKFAERAEKLAYNALPAELTEDMWAHQYLQQPNAVQASVQEDHFWHHDGVDATTMNLEPNFPCCTGNFNQGFPKFATNLAAKGPGMLVLAMLAPCRITTRLSSSAGVTSVNVSTSYPWGSTLNISIAAPTPFTFAFRVPAWAESATVNGAVLPPLSNGTLHRIAVAAGKTVLEIVLPMQIRVERRYNNAASIFRGPLLYSLNLSATQTEMDYCKPLNGSQTDGSTMFCSNATYQVEQHGYSYSNASAWNYGINVSSLEFEEVTGLDRSVPFSTSKSPVAINAKARQVDWGIEHGSAAAPPQSPVKSGAAEETVRLIPYGSTHGLSLVELPTLA